jgi:hypothetical protein
MVGQKDDYTRLSERYFQIFNVFMQLGRTLATFSSWKVYLKKYCIYVANDV